LFGLHTTYADDTNLISANNISDVSRTYSETNCNTL